MDSAERIILAVGVANGSQRFSCEIFVFAALVSRSTLGAKLSAQTVILAVI